MEKIKPYKFSLNYPDKPLLDLVKKTDKKILAVWALDCVQKFLPDFEKAYSNDVRPRNALIALQDWIETGVFKMAIIRKASLDSHASAREIGEDNHIRSIARAAGQAVATAHTPLHSLGAANYLLQSVYRNSELESAKLNVEAERRWQYNHLTDLLKLR